MIKDRNIVLKREGNKLLLPTIDVLDGIAPDNIPNYPYLMCRITEYYEHSGVVELKLLPDKVGEHSYQISVEVNSESLLSANIKRLVFRDLPAKPIMRQSSNPVRTILNNDDLSGNDDVRSPIQKKIDSLPVEPKIIPEERPKEKEITRLTIELPVKELQFSNGKVSFEYYIKRLNRKVSFFIDNQQIKKEYDSIKNYFPKALGIKKFTLNLYVESLDEEVKTHSATSPQVEQITDSLFETVEDLYIEDFFISNPEDEIYSLKQRAVESAKKIGSEKMQDAAWLLNKLITKSKTKHYYHLRYLSSKHLSETFNIRLTGKPLSFIFLLQSGNGYYMVWETYSTQEATYVWRINALDRLELQREIESLITIIKRLRKNNKLAYLREKPENFIRIEHDYSGEDMGFKKWKGLLEEFISNPK